MSKRPVSVSRIRPIITASNAVENPKTPEVIGFWDLIRSFFWRLINWFFPVKTLVHTKTEQKVDFTPEIIHNSWNGPQYNDFMRPQKFFIKDFIFNGKNGIGSWSDFHERLKFREDVYLYITAIYITYTDPKNGNRMSIYRNNLSDVDIIKEGQCLYIKLCRTGHYDTFIKLNDDDFQINVTEIVHRITYCMRYR